MGENSDVWRSKKRRWKEGGWFRNPTHDWCTVDRFRGMLGFMTGCILWRVATKAVCSLINLLSNPPSQMDGPQLLWESVRALHEESWCLLPTNCCFSTVTENVSFQTQPVVGEGVHLIRNRSFVKSWVELIRNYSPESYINPAWRGTTIQASSFFFSPWEMICNTLPLQLFQPALVQ